MITLTKALATDIDADAIGATVNLQLRETRDEPALNLFASDGLNSGALSNLPGQ